MTEPAFFVRPARVEDIPILLEARRRMFADMGEADAPGRAEGEVRIAAWLAERIPDGRAAGFVAVADDGAWLGAMTISHEESVPSRHNPSGRHSYLFGLSVRPEYRRQGVAGALVTAAVDAARASGEGAVTLVASDFGRSLYEKLGFKAAPAMRIFFEDEGSANVPQEESC
jgi:GNAT superfamily N-acetyltransferase